MYNDNRPLHVAATLSGVTEAQQLEIVTTLLKYGANKARRNKANKLPIELVPHDRDQVKVITQVFSMLTLIDIRLLTLHFSRFQVKAVLQARARPFYV